MICANRCRRARAGKKRVTQRRLRTISINGGRWITALRRSKTVLQSRQRAADRLHAARVAAVREASNARSVAALRRAMIAAVLHGGQIAEMKTGEGKTCRHTALYLNALAAWCASGQPTITVQVGVQ